MKPFVFSVLLFFAGAYQSLFAFDPAGGPPPSSSLSRTIHFVSNVTRPMHDIRDETLSSTLDFIAILEIPKKYGVVIDASAMKLPEETRVTVVGKDLSILAAAGIVAEQIKADILIRPGKILLVPKEAKAQEPPADQERPRND